MTELAHYFEIVTVGLLLFYALSPIMTATSEELRKDKHFCPPLAAALNLPEKSSGIGALLVAAMIAGFVSNQAIDAITHDDKVGPRQTYEAMYKCWLSGTAVSELRAEGDQCPARAGERADEHRQWPAQNLKIAEFDLAKDNEYARDYFARHKAAIRIMRAAAAAGLVFICSMLTYEILRRRRDWGNCRYRLVHFAFAIVVTGACVLVYVSETGDYYKHIFELETRSSRESFLGSAQAMRCPHLPRLDCLTKR
jgi:hypothetical protein